MTLLLHQSLCAGLLLGLLGCSGAEVNITEILNHGQCRKLDVGLQQITMQALPGIRGARMLKLDATTDLTTAPVSSGEVLLVAISNGAQATAGFHFELMNVAADGLVVKLNYAWRTPEPGAMVAQVRTTPCSVVQLEAFGKIQAVTALLDGQPFGRIELDSAG